MTQREMVLALLRERPEGVCSTTYLALYVPRAAARVHELRAEGYDIRTEPCTLGHAHATAQRMYVLSEAPTQLAW